MAYLGAGLNAPPLFAGVGHPRWRVELIRCRASAPSRHRGTGAGEITYLDADYDERMGEALRPLPWGVRRLAEASFLVLNLPPTDGEKMTAYAVARMKQCIRRASPLSVRASFRPTDHVRRFGPTGIVGLGSDSPS